MTVSVDLPSYAFGEPAERDTGMNVPTQGSSAGVNPDELSFTLKAVSTSGSRHEATNPRFLECAHVVTPPAAEIFFSQVRAPCTLGLPAVTTQDRGPDWCYSYDVTNGMMLECALHRGYDDFLWSVTGGNGIYRAFVFVDDHVGLEHGAQLKFPGPVERAQNKYKNTYIKNQFPHAKSFRRHYAFTSEEMEEMRQDFDADFSLDELSENDLRVHVLT
ncbi:hypothetical protein HDU89_007821 [Geranomyces variabilis]|nr:hypothetical protein HDU89_007821 [Geranomyces variabilis]